MKCELCCEETKDEIIAVFKTASFYVCKECADALYTNKETLEVSIVEPMPKR
jgi:ribosome-binding protein aMBF1 (putative translation factor)